MKLKTYLFTFLTLLVFSGCEQEISKNSTTFLFVGSYTDGEKKEGITVFQLNEVDETLTEVEKEGNLINASFLAISPNKQFLYACTDTKLETNGSVSSFEIDSMTGQITFLNKQSTGGRNPVHLAVDRNNEFVINANYTDAGICVFKCKPDGSISPFSQLIEFEGSSIIQGRQDAAHVHSCNFSPDNQYLFVPDLGSDMIRTFSFDKKGTLEAVDSLIIKTKKGSGPRHFTFHPNQSFAYSIEELSGTISAYNYKNGQLDSLNSYPSYREIQDEYASSDIHISPDGKYLYASNRQEENTISIFLIDSINGELTLKGHQSTFGRIPRSFVISPSGHFLIVANQSTNQLIVFKRDIKSGLLIKTEIEIKIDAPASLKMVKYGS